MAPPAANSTDEWTHWYGTISNFHNGVLAAREKVDKTPEHEVKLNLLINYVSTQVSMSISDYVTSKTMTSLRTRFSDATLWLTVLTWSGF